MNDQPEKTTPQAENAQGESPNVKKRWFGRGIYGSKDVPIRVLDACIGLMIAAALLLTLWGATHSGFTVTFNTGMDDVTVPAQKIQHGQTVAQPETPLRPGYTLAGWSLTPEPEVNYWDFAADKVETDFTLYAVWQPASFLVRFDLAGGTGDDPSITVTYGEPYGPLPTPQREGYTFAGWQYSGQTITADTVVTMTGEHLLTAVWQ